MEKVWFCKIGYAEDSELSGSDKPMRDAVEAAFEEITGRSSGFTFSGWGGALTEGELAAHEDRLPDPVKVAAGYLAGLTADQRQLIDDALMNRNFPGADVERRVLLRALDEADAIAGHLA